MKPVMNNMSVVVSRVLQIVVRYFNPIMRLVLGSRAHRMMSGQLMLLSFTGRRTGRSYTTPVSYVREGTNLLVPGGGARLRGIAYVRTVPVAEGTSRLRGHRGRIGSTSHSVADRCFNAFLREWRATPFGSRGV